MVTLHSTQNKLPVIQIKRHSNKGIWYKKTKITGPGEVKKTQSTFQDFEEHAGIKKHYLYTDLNPHSGKKQCKSRQYVT